MKHTFKLTVIENNTKTAKDIIVQSKNVVELLKEKEIIELQKEHTIIEVYKKITVLRR